MAGGTRILYDLVPCISFRGWPQIAAAWLQETGRFWQRAGLPHSEAAGAFHLLPGSGEFVSMHVASRSGETRLAACQLDR